MLSFDSTLSNALLRDACEPFYVCKLYYNDETKFIGISDKDREDGADFYYGIAKTWSEFHQSADFFNFTTSIGNGVLKLSNADNQIDGGRFSDLFSTYNFANRKWELFLNEGSMSTLDTAARMVGTGIISGEIIYDDIKVVLELLDLSPKVHKRVPTAIVASATYTNAPPNNLDAPVPMSFGDFDRSTTSGDFERHYVKSRFPAIISNKQNSSGLVEALPDTDQGTDVILNQLRAKNVFMTVDNNWLACDENNVTMEGGVAGADRNPASTSENKMKFSGTNWLGLFTFYTFTDSSGLSTPANLIDEDLTTSDNFGRSGAGTVDFKVRFPKVPKLGELADSTDIDIVFLFGTFTGTPAIGFRITGPIGAGGNIAILWGAGNENQTVALNADSFSAANEAAVDLESETLDVEIDHTGGGAGVIQVQIYEIGLQIQYVPKQIYTQILEKEESLVYTGLQNPYRIVETVTESISGPSNVDYVYYSGIGREYGAWIDTLVDPRDTVNGSANDPGYNQGAVIENPIYQIEDVLRSELSLDATPDGSDIDTESFDIAGNTTNGHLGDAFNNAVGDVKFAWSQPRFVDSTELIKKLCQQCCSWVWISGSGKFKIKTRRGPDDYASADKTINFDDIELQSISKTPISRIRNDITVNYKMDYISNVLLSQATSGDATSKGTTVNGVNQTLNLKIDADKIIDSTTAQQLATAYKDFFKDQWIEVKFSTKRFMYSDLEICDIVNFENVPPDVKLFGATWSEANDATGDYFIITDIEKSLDGIKITCTQVSD